MTDAAATELEQIKTRLSEVERLAKHQRQQLEIHATNTEKSLESHKGAMDAYHEAQAKFQQGQQKLSELIHRLDAAEAEIKALKSAAQAPQKA